MDRIMNYPRGSVMVFTSGEYSDYRTSGFLVAVQDCNLPVLAQKMANGKGAHIDQDANPDNFPSWLIANGYAMPVDHSLIHLGEYRRWSDQFGVVLTDD